MVAPRAVGVIRSIFTGAAGGPPVANSTDSVALEKALKTQLAQETAIEAKLTAAKADWEAHGGLYHGVASLVASDLATRLSAGTRFLMGSTWFWIKFCEGQERIPLTYIDSQRTSAGLSS